MKTINVKLLPVKAHYFFFMASLGPILPQLSVMGKQLGISSVVMGLVTGVLPIMFLIAKPAFGYVADKFRTFRKQIFIALIIAMALFYDSLYFINTSTPPLPFPSKYCTVFEPNNNNNTVTTTCDNSLLNCTILSQLAGNSSTSFMARLSNDVDTICIMRRDEQPQMNASNEELLCRQVAPCPISLHFWSFVVLMGAGTIAFNVINSISDAICFDVLMMNDNEQSTTYGKQRVWGTIGFGLSALITGYAVDANNSFTPALLAMTILLVIDIICCSHLELPHFESSEHNIMSNVVTLVTSHRRIFVFLLFACFAGVLDSFFVYFFFWYVEDLADVTGGLEQHIKLLEGAIVAAETLGSEVLFFYVSGTIIRVLGYGNALSVCFGMYALRLGIVSVLPSPWWAVLVELFLQGPTYALCYATIVAYANDIAPAGASATMQGLVAGIDDGLGYALGSISGGILYRLLGGRQLALLFACLALFCAILHFILYRTLLQTNRNDDDLVVSIQYTNPPNDTIKTCHD